MMVILVVFLIGLCVGSWVNVAVDRWSKDLSVIGPRSSCDHCSIFLRWFELVPIVSWLGLRGRCGHCLKKISGYYPLVELSTAVVFSLSFLVLPMLILGKVLFLAVATILLVVFFADLKYGIIPDQAIVLGIIFTVLWKLELLMGKQDFIFEFMTSAIMGICAALFFYLLYWFSKKKGIGFGDVKLALFLGFFLGFPKIIMALYLAFVSGGIVALAMIISRRKKFGQTLPFAPFLALSTYLVAIYEDPIKKLFFGYL